MIARPEGEPRFRSDGIAGLSQQCGLPEAGNDGWVRWWESSGEASHRRDCWL